MGWVHRMWTVFYEYLLSQELLAASAASTLSASFLGSRFEYSSAHAICWSFKAEAGGSVRSNRTLAEKVCLPAASLKPSSSGEVVVPLLFSLSPGWLKAGTWLLVSVVPVLAPFKSV